MVIINGVQMTEEQYASLLEEAKRKYEQVLQEFREVFDCNNAIIHDVRGTPEEMIHNSPVYITCSIDNLVVPDDQFCRNCKAYNNTNYEEEWNGVS